MQNGISMVYVAATAAAVAAAKTALATTESFESKVIIHAVHIEENALYSKNSCTKTHLFLYVYCIWLVMPHI